MRVFGKFITENQNDSHAAFDYAHQYIIAVAALVQQVVTISGFRDEYR